MSAAACTICGHLVVSHHENIGCTEPGCDCSTVNEPWVPDGQGLAVEALGLIAAGVGGAVHLRFTSGARYPRDACGVSIGEWWTGRTDEVTCTACREWVHA